MAHRFLEKEGVASGLPFPGKWACAGCLGRWAAPAAWFVGPGAKWKCRAPGSKGMKDFMTGIAEAKPKQGPSEGTQSTRPGGWPRGWHSLDLSVTRCGKVTCLVLSALWQGFSGLDYSWNTVGEGGEEGRGSAGD